MIVAVSSARAAVFSIPEAVDRGPQEGDVYSLKWMTTATPHIDFSINNGGLLGIDADDESGTPYTDVRVNGMAGFETLTVDFINGALSRPPASPTITFFGQAGDDNMIVLENVSPADSLTMNPDQIIVHDGVSGFDTTINYDAGVSTIVVPEPLVAAALLPMLSERIARRRRRSAFAHSFPAIA